VLKKKQKQGKGDKRGVAEGAGNLSGGSGPNLRIMKPFKGDKPAEKRPGKLRQCRVTRSREKKTNEHETQNDDEKGVVRENIERLRRSRYHE